MDEFFKENEFEKQFPSLTQLPLDALPLPGFDKGEFWRSFKFPTKKNREPDSAQVEPNATLFICEEVEPKKYQYVIGTLVSAKKQRLTLKPLYFKKTAHRGAFMRDDPPFEWRTSENKGNVEMNLFSTVVFSTILKRIDTEMVLEYFKDVVIIKKNRYLYHGSNYAFDELEDKPFFLSFSYEDAWIKRYIYKFELLQDITVLNLNKIHSNAKEQLLDFLSNGKSATNGSEVQNAILRRFKQKTLAFDYESYVFSFFDQDRIQGIKAKDIHETVRQFELIKKGGMDFNYDEDVTKEVQIFKPRDKLKLISRDDLFTDTTTNQNYFMFKVSGKVSRLGKSITRNPNTFIVGKHIVGSFTQYAIVQDDKPICKHVFFSKDRLISALMSPKYENSKHICPLCAKSHAMGIK